MRFEWLLPQRREQISPLSCPPPPICALNCDVSIFEIGGMSAGGGGGWLATSDDYYNHYKLPSADNELNNSHKGAAECEAETSSTTPAPSLCTLNCRKYSQPQPRATETAMHSK